MARIDLKNKVIQAKLVYYGPGLCGKTTNLEYVNKHINQGQELMSLSTEGDRTIFFDFMPFELGKLRGMDVNFKLYTVPGQVRYNETRKMVLKNTDGIVFVADSQELMVDANLESFHNMFANLRELGIAPDDITIILQYNKRDLPNVLEPRAMDELLNPRGYPRFLASAFKGDGVIDTLKEACTRTLNRLVAQLPVKESKSDKELTAAQAPRPATPPARPAVASPVAAPAAAPAPVAPAIAAADVASLVAESAKLRGLLEEQTKLLRELGAGTRTALESLKAKVEQAVSRTELEGLNRRVEQLTKAVDSLPRGNDAATKTDVSALGKHLAGLASRADVEKHSESIGKLIAVHPNGDDRVLRAIDALVTKSELSQRLSDLPRRSDVEKLPAATRALFSDPTTSMREATKDLATKSELRALDTRLGEIPSRAELDKIRARLEALATREDLDRVSVDLALLTKRLAEAPSARPRARSNGAGSDEAQLRAEAAVAERAAMTPVRAVTSRSWPPTLTPQDTKETMRPSGAYPPLEQVPTAEARTRISSEPPEPDIPPAEPAPPAPVAVDDVPGVGGKAPTIEAAPVARAAPEVEEAPEPAKLTEVEAAPDVAKTPEVAETPEVETAPDVEQAAVETKPAQSGLDAPAPPPAEGAAEPAAPRAPISDAQNQNAARIARVMVADLYLYNKEAVEEGIRNDDFFERNKEALSDMRVTYESRVPSEVREQTQHFDSAVRDFIAKKKKQLGLE